MRSLTDGSSSTASEANEDSVGTTLLVVGERRDEAARMASSSLRLRLSLTRSDKLLTIEVKKGHISHHNLAIYSEQS